MQFLGKIWQNRMLAPPLLESWRPLLGEILDPPLKMKEFGPPGRGASLVSPWICQWNSLIFSAMLVSKQTKYEKTEIQLPSWTSFINNKSNDVTILSYIVGPNSLNFYCLVTFNFCELKNLDECRIFLNVRIFGCFSSFSDLL